MEIRATPKTIKEPSARRQDRDFLHSERQGRHERSEERNQEGPGQSEGFGDGRLIRYSEGALWTSKGGSENKNNRDHADILRHPHCECGQPRKTKVSPTRAGSLTVYAWNATIWE